MAVRDLRVEGDRQPVVLDLVVETDERLAPRAAEVADVEHRHCVLGAVERRLAQRGLTLDPQRDPHGPLHTAGGQVELLDAGSVLVAYPGDVGREPLLESLKVDPGLASPRRDLSVDVETAAPLPEHASLDPLSQHRRHRPEVVADFVDLLGHPQQKRVVIAQGVVAAADS